MTEGHTTIRDLLCSRNQDPDGNAIESPGCLPLTYRALRLQTESVVRDLNARGLYRNDRVAIVTPSGPETATCIIAVMAGCTAVPLNPQSREREYRDVFERAGIRAVIVHREYRTEAAAVARAMAIPVIELVRTGNTAGLFNLTPAITPGSAAAEFSLPADTAFVLFTSGTTAEAKIIPVSQQKSTLTMLRTCRALGMTAADRSLHIVPYFHGMGLSAPLLSPLFCGGTVICTKDFIPADFFSLLTTFRPTFYTAGPAIQRALIKELKKLAPEQREHHSLRFIRCGSGFLPGDLQRDLESLLHVPVLAAYSMSEAGNVAVNFPSKPDSVGIPLVRCLRIIDGNGSPLPPNEPGEIVIKDEAVIDGYEGAPEETAAAFTDGWFRTGDLGYLDNDGFLFLTGRKKEIINKGGEKISPAEIDAVLLTHPGVREAMTFPLADPVFGEDIAALIVPGDADLTEEELRGFLLDRLTPFKLPRRMYFTDAIPKTPSGKVIRREGTRRYS